jgi:hypothetical protein
VKKLQLAAQRRLQKHTFGIFWFIQPNATESKKISRARVF